MECFIWVWKDIFKPNSHVNFFELGWFFAEGSSVPQGIMDFKFHMHTWIQRKFCFSNCLNFKQLHTCHIRIELLTLFKLEKFLPTHLCFRTNMLKYYRSDIWEIRINLQYSTAFLCPYPWVSNKMKHKLDICTIDGIVTFGENFFKWKYRCIEI